jgi:hypothetical protein
MTTSVEPRRTAAQGASVATDSHDRRSQPLGHGEPRGLPGHGERQPRLSRACTTAARRVPKDNPDE